MELRIPSSEYRPCQLYCAYGWDCDLGKCPIFDTYNSPEISQALKLMDMIPEGKYCRIFTGEVNCPIAIVGVCAFDEVAEYSLDDIGVIKEQVCPKPYKGEG